MNRQAWQELGVLLVLLFIINLIWAPSDPGFTHSRPHPYLIVVLAMAARHGASAALTGVAICVGAFLLLGQYSDPAVTFSSLLQRPWNFVMAVWVLLGATMGAVTDARLRKQESLEESLGFLKSELSENTKRLELSEAENLELRKKVFGESVTLTTVYEVARKLITLTGKELFEAGLELVERFVGANHCSIYLLDGGRRTFQLKQSRGTGGNPPPSTVTRGDALFEKCFREARVVSVKDLFSAEAPRRLVDAVLVAPLGRFDNEGARECGVLVVHRLPMNSLNSQTIGVFNLLADWISRSLNLLEQFETAEDPTSELSAQIQSRRFSTLFIQTLARVSPVEKVALEVLGSEESSEVAYWNASKMFEVTAQSKTIISEEPFLKAIDILLANGCHLGSVLTSLPVGDGSPGCQGLRIRIQERAELNAQAALRVLKAYVAQFHESMLPELKALERESAPSRRHYHLDNISDKLSFLKAKKQALEISLGLNRPDALPVTPGDLMLSLAHDPDQWTRRLASLASHELGQKVDEETMQSLQHSNSSVDRELGSYLSEMPINS